MKRSLSGSRFDAAALVGVSLAYCVNRFWWKSALDIPVLSYLLRCHFNDWLAGICVMAYLNLTMSLSGYRLRLATYSGAAAVCLACGLLWEYVLPTVFPHGTSDVWDVAAYVWGGLTYVRLRRRRGRRPPAIEHKKGADG